jgi:hypothetical protein
MSSKEMNSRFMGVGPKGPDNAVKGVIEAGSPRYRPHTLGAHQTQ